MELALNETPLDVKNFIFSSVFVGMRSLFYQIDERRRKLISSDSENEK